MAARRAQARRWLRPGIGIKRWLLVVFLGELLLALAFAVVLRDLFRDTSSGAPSNGLIDVLTLAFLPPEIRLLLLFVAGVALFGYGSWRAPPGADQSLTRFGKSHSSRCFTSVEFGRVGQTSWLSVAEPACPCCSAV